MFSSTYMEPVTWTLVIHLTIPNATRNIPHLDYKWSYQEDVNWCLQDMKGIREYETIAYDHYLKVRLNGIESKEKAKEIEDILKAKCETIWK